MIKLKKNSVIADLHIHSKHSRGCSKDLDIDNLVKWAKIKGVGLLGTGDFTHPEWIVELKEKLEEKEPGVFREKKTGFPFILQTEISLIYSQNGKGRRIHIVILAPSFDVVDKITEYLLRHGRIDYDGRPIFKIPADKLAKDLKLISERIELIPAHVWTPHFSLFGAYNQFSKLEDAFGEESKHIYSLETGLSSDPPMNRRVSSLDNLNLLSFSDCHSFWPWRLGREATIFEFDELSYDNVIKAIRTGQGLVGTIEVDPNYGKYHFDGHRKCGVVYDPKESLEHKGICPVCRKPLTVGVATRIEELCDREENYTKSDDKLFLYLIPLHELISKRLSKGINTKQVWEAYNKLIKVFGDEYKILLNASKEELLGVVDEELTNLIIKNRKGGLEVLPGFDGEYGVLVFNEDDKEKNKPKKEEGILHPQRSLSDFA